MADADFEKLSRLAALAASDIGTSEEEVKVNFAVPLLEALGHSRLRLEYKQRDIVVHSGGHRPLSVIIETKRAGEPLDRHLAQLERYAADEKCFLALLTNGEELRFYAPPWPGVPTFAQALLWEIRRADLANPTLARDVASCLSPNALASGEAAQLVATCQEQLDLQREKLDRVQEEAQARRDGIAGRLRELDRHAASIERERTKLRAGLQEVDAWEESVIGELHPSAAFPRSAKRRAPAAASPPPSAAPEAAAEPQPEPPSSRRPKPWRDEELFDAANEPQRRIFALFARNAKTGRRTLGTKDIAAQTGLTPQQVNGALARFAHAGKVGTREPLFEITRPVGKGVRVTGVLFTLIEKYWEAIQRLYPG